MSIRKGNITISGLGSEGYSPVATVTKSGSISTITITDKNGTTTAEVLDGDVAPNITVLTGTSINLSSDGVYSINISANTTFNLPVISDGKFHQIMIFTTITGTPTIDFGTTYYFNAEAPTVKAGTFNIIYEYDGSNWYVGMVKKGSAN